MECDLFREALSAHLDGEEATLPQADTAAHVAGCAGCRAWNDDLMALHGMIRVRPADPVPDLSAAIVAAHLPAAGGGRRAWLRGRAAAPSVRPALADPISGARWALFVVALTQLILAGPALLLGDDAGATVHVARELGTFDVALAIGLVVAAWQPARAWGLLPVAAAFGLVLVGAAGLDLADGTIGLGGETHHLLDLAGVVLLWRVAREWRRHDVITTPTARPA
jgi:predicted anti-sigma-YlaC factor YlaD